MSDLLSAAPLRGEIRRIVYENAEGTYAVLRMAGDDGREFTAVGALCHLTPGQSLEMTGAWEKHEEYGRQFRVASFRPVMPATRAGLIRFLGSGAIPGIGPKTAALIVGRFGEETLHVLDHESRRLREVPGIGPHKAKTIIAAWRAGAARRDIFIFLQGLGITPAFCQKLYLRYGAQTVEVIRANPYRLAEEVDGIGFLKADAIAAELGIAKDSPERMNAAAVFTMNQETGNGHVCLPEELFVHAVAELAEQPEERARLGIERALERRQIVLLDGFYYTAALARAETELPQLVRNLAAARAFAGARCVPLPGGEKGIVLCEEQQLAAERVRQAPLGIITGGPGVGKTTVLGEIVRRAKRARLRIAAAAPTGRAAKRLGESTGLAAKTLHRLLVFDPQTGRFGYDRSNPLPYDLVIVDECSMLDLMLALALFRAIAPGTSVLLVGDRDQLPSVGPGRVLADFIASGLFLTTHLDRVFRQAEGSRIILNAHRINRGEAPERPAPGTDLSDFYWIEQDDPERVLELIVRLNTERIPRRFGLDPVDDVQILTPMNRGSCGTQTINAALQQALNGGEKPTFTYGDRVFKLDDKVMQISNNYDKSVYNGDLGRIARIEPAKKKFSVLFDRRAVEYDFSDADQLVVAYAVTVHKSQGSEFPAVILPLLTQHYMMLQRNLLYTAVTRARRLLVLIGSRRAVEMAVRNTRQAPRYSRLLERLKGELPPPRFSPQPGVSL